MTEKIENTIVHLIGFPGTGKYTVATALSSRADFRIVDNHLINNPVFSVLKMDGKMPLPAEVWQNTRKIWRIVLDTIIHLSPVEYNFVLTNALIDGDADDAEWFQEVRAFAQKRGSRFVPVVLKISDVEEHKRRISSHDREHRLKITNPARAERYATEALLNIDHPTLLTLDVTNLSANDVADKILQHISKI